MAQIAGGFMDCRQRRGGVRRIGCGCRGFPVFGYAERCGTIAEASRSSIAPVCRLANRAWLAPLE